MLNTRDDRTPGRFCTHQISGVVAALLMVCTGCGTLPDLQTARVLQDAEAAFAAATQKEEFVRVAVMYQQVIDDGFTSGSVFYNQGNAWMRAEQKGRAIASYRQAQRFLPRDPYLEANLQQALVGVTTREPRSILGYVFFWQKSLSFTEKAILTTCMLAIVGLLVVFWQLRIQPAACRRLLAMISLPLLLIVASVGRDWNRFERIQHGVVTVSEAIARKGDSETYEPAFTQPLTDGAEFVVLETRPGWYHAQVGAAGTAWIRDRDAYVY